MRVSQQETEIFGFSIGKRNGSFLYFQVCENRSKFYSSVWVLLILVPFQTFLFDKLKINQFV